MITRHSRRLLLLLSFGCETGRLDVDSLTLLAGNRSCDHQVQVERVALKVGGAKKKGGAGPASVTLTIASLPGTK